MDTLHQHGYDLSNALASLVPSTGPVLCRDEMEEWSASEANLFEEALDKYGKDFVDIRTDFVSTQLMQLRMNNKFTNMCFLYFSVTMENAEECNRVLLHVENNGSICSTEKSEGCRGGE